MSVKPLISMAALLGALVPVWALAAGLEVRVLGDTGGALHGAVVSLHPAASGGAGTLPAGERPRAVMDQRDKQFVPRVLAVRTGTAVSFPNSDDIRHHVYSFSAPKRFEIKLYHGTPSEPIVFDSPGVVTLGCNIHDQMLGYIYITDSAQFTQTDASGLTRMDNITAGSYDVHVWHPDMGAETLPVVTPAQLTDKAVTQLRVQVPIHSEAPPELTPLEQKFRQQSGHVH